MIRDGVLIKTDALDHARAHDFVGAQPLAWDIAGAITELELTPLETGMLLAQIRANGIQAPAVIDPMMLAYLSFQLGAWTMSSGGDSPMAARYGRLIAQRLTSSPAP
jgi:hypothetical protein